jgi:hypothetical protein
MPENFHLFLASGYLIAGPVAVTYNDKGGREKRESCGRNEMKTILIINILNKLILRNRPYLK